MGSNPIAPIEYHQQTKGEINAIHIVSNNNVFSKK